MASAGLLAHVLVSKYCDHTPLYRQSQIFARHGVEIERSTLANWVGGACWWLEPLQARLAAHVFGSDKIFADDTPIPVLDPGRGRTKTGRLWVYTRDDRPWSGPDPPAAATSCWRPVGRTHGASSLTCTNPPVRPSRRKPCAASPSSMRSGDLFARA